MVHVQRLSQTNLASVCNPPTSHILMQEMFVFGSGWDVVGRLKYLKSCLRLSPSLFLLLGCFFCLSALSKSLLQASVVEKIYIFNVILEMVLTNLVLFVFFRC